MGLVKLGELGGLLLSPPCFLFFLPSFFIFLVVELGMEYKTIAKSLPESYIPVPTGEILDFSLTIEAS